MSDRHTIARDYLFRFRNFRVYQEARTFRKQISAFCKTLPEAERFILLPQVLRAVNSIILNIAEGANRRTDVDFSRFLNQALTSLEEVVACLDIALDEGYIRVVHHETLLVAAHTIGRQLLAFSATVKEKAQRGKF